MESSVINGTSVSYSSYQVSKIIVEYGTKVLLEAWIADDYTEAADSAYDMAVSYEDTILVSVCRLAKVQKRQNPNMEQKGRHDVLPLDEVLFIN